MTPADHIALAEQLVDKSRSTDAPMMPEERIYTTLQAITHALIALAVENGAPHSTPTPEGT